MDIIEFAEKVQGKKLMSWQKKMLQVYQRGDPIYYIPHRPGRFTVIKIIHDWEESKEN